MLARPSLNRLVGGVLGRRPQQCSSSASLVHPLPIATYYDRCTNHHNQQHRCHSTQQAKRHHERRLIKFPGKLLYEVVSDVANYQHFVPWCQQSIIVEPSDGKHMKAELVVGFKYLTERYISNVSMVEPSMVTASSSQTQVFDTLKSEWKFTPASDPNHTWVTFQVDFKFKSALYNELSDFFLSEVVKKMVQAFEQRCKTLHEQRKAAAESRVAAGGQPVAGVIQSNK